MAYFFTENDLNALVEVWGAEALRFGDGGHGFLVIIIAK